MGKRQNSPKTQLNTVQLMLKLLIKVNFLNEPQRTQRTQREERKKGLTELYWDTASSTNSVNATPKSATQAQSGNNSPLAKS